MSITARLSTTHSVVLFAMVARHAGADANKGFLYRALTPAADELKIARALLAGRANSSAECRLCGDTPLLVAADTGQLAATQLLLGAAANVETANADGTTPLLAAARKGHLNIAKLLLQAGADKDKTHALTGTTAPIMAIERGHHDMAKLLLSGGADRDKGRMMTPLFLAAKRGDLEMVHILLDTGISTSSGSGASRPKRARYS